MKNSKYYSLILSVMILVITFLPTLGASNDDPIIIYDESGAREDSLAHELGKADSSDSSISGDIYDMIYKSIFVDSARHRDLSLVDKFTKSEEMYIPFNGKRIGKIYRKNVQIFGGSIHDTTEIPTTGLSNLANKLHVNTRDLVIQQNLIIEPGDTINPFKLADNERIIRKLPFIYDVKIVPILNKDDEDLVDLLIITQDVFSIGVGGSVYASDRFKLNIFERNLAGMGWEFDNEFYFNAVKSPEFGYDGKFFISNIAGTFISSLVNYAKLYDVEKYLLSLNRGFLTPETKYAGGLDLRYTTNYTDSNNVRDLNNKVMTQDYWFGRAFQLGDVSQRKNLTLSVRFLGNNFKFRPPVQPDSNFIYHNSEFALASIYLTKILHFQSRHIRGFGYTEDVPYGYNISFTMGYGRTEFEERIYNGLRLRGATFSDEIGYLSGILGFGSYYDGRQIEDGVIDLSSLYFTPLLDFGADYKFRQFISGYYTIGIRRLKDDQLDLEQNRGVPLFNSDKLRGTQRASLSLQSVIFFPWNWIGFRFALEGFIDVGWIGSNYKPPQINNINSAVGFIFRLRNDNLVMSTFQIGFVFYPKALAGTNRFNWAFSTAEPRLFGQLEDRKPGIIPYR
jgi:hypothetical protein